MLDQIEPTASPHQRERSGHALLRDLASRLAKDIERVLASRVWQVLASATTSDVLVQAILRELYWDIACYQPFTTRSGFRMIGGASAQDMQVMRTLLLHKWDEVEHRQWAWNCYLALGGDSARSLDRLSPGAFAVSAVWERLADRHSALSYVGAEYLFEGLTAQLAPLVADRLSARGINASGLQFIADHAVEDQKHKNLFEKLIVDIGDARPDLHQEVLYTYDCFAWVYPHQLWEGCLHRAAASAGVTIDHG